MSRRDDCDRSRTRRRRDRIPRLVKFADENMTPVSDGMDWSNPMTWQHKHSSPSSFPPSQNNYLQHPLPAQAHHSTPCFHQYPPVNYMMPFPPEPAPVKPMKTTMVLPDNPHGRQPEPAAATGHPAPLPVRPKKASEEWQPGDGLLDRTPLYSFTLPMTVAATPHNSHRDMSGMDIRNVRLVQVIHDGISNWLLRPFAHGRFVTWEGFRTRTEALLWSTCSKLLRRSQPLNLLTLEKDLAGSMGLNIDDFNQRTKVHEHLGNLVLEFLRQHHRSIKAHSPEDDTLQKYHNLKREHELLQAQCSASQRSSPPSTANTHKDDSELVTPPPVNHSQSSTPTSSLPTVSAAAFDGKSYDVPPQRQPRIIQSLHGMLPPPVTQTGPKLLTMNSAPEDIIKRYTCTSDQPRVFLKQAPTTTAAPALIKWANHPSRLNGNKISGRNGSSAHQSSLFLPSVLSPTAGQRGGLFPARFGEPVSPPFERHRTERANSRSPRR